MQVYLDISAIGMLFLGGALACHGKLATSILFVFHSKLGRFEVYYFILLEKIVGTCVNASASINLDLYIFG
jgi:hypothetical protein